MLKNKFPLFYCSIILFYALNNIAVYAIFKPFPALEPSAALKIIDTTGLSNILCFFGTHNVNTTILCIGLIAFAVSLFFLYKICELIKDKETGYIAMVLYALVPSTYLFSRVLHRMDFHITAFVILSIYLLLKTNFFSSLKYSLLFGITFGLGVIVRDTFLGFCLAPFLYVSFLSLKKPKLSRAVNIAAAIFTAAALLYTKYNNIMAIKMTLLKPLIENTRYSDLGEFLINLCAGLFSPLVLILFIIGAICFVKKFNGYAKNILLLWFFVPLAILIAMPHNKDTAMALALVPATAIITSVGLLSLPRKYVKLIFSATFIILLLQFFVLSYSRNIINTAINAKPILIYKTPDPAILFNQNQTPTRLINIINAVKQKTDGKKAIVLFKYDCDKVDYYNARATMKLFTHEKDINYTYSYMLPEAFGNEDYDVIIDFLKLTDYQSFYEHDLKTLKAEYDKGVIFGNFKLSDINTYKEILSKYVFKEEVVIDEENGISFYVHTRKAAL
jgi:hypothetical protein